MGRFKMYRHFDFIAEDELSRNRVPAERRHFETQDPAIPHETLMHRTDKSLRIQLIPRIDVCPAIGPVGLTLTEYCRGLGWHNPESAVDRRLSSASCFNVTHLGIPRYRDAIRPPGKPRNACLREINKARPPDIAMTPYFVERELGYAVCDPDLDLVLANTLNDCCATDGCTQHNS
jgi:hypothetical protein